MIISLQNPFFLDVETTSRHTFVFSELHVCQVVIPEIFSQTQRSDCRQFIHNHTSYGHMTWVSPAFIFDCGWFETGTFILYCCDSITTLLCISEIFRHSKYDKYHWFTLYDRNNIHISLILSWQNMTLSTWLILTVCRTRVVIDLVHRRVTVAQW